MFVIHRHANLVIYTYVAVDVVVVVVLFFLPSSTFYVYKWAPYALRLLLLMLHVYVRSVCVLQYFIDVIRKFED